MIATTTTVQCCQNLMLLHLLWWLTVFPLLSSSVEEIHSCVCIDDPCKGEDIRDCNMNILNVVKTDKTYNNDNNNNVDNIGLATITNSNSNRLFAQNNRREKQQWLRLRRQQTGKKVIKTAKQQGQDVFHHPQKQTQKQRTPKHALPFVTTNYEYK